MQQKRIFHPARIFYMEPISTIQTNTPVQLPGDESPGMEATSSSIQKLCSQMLKVRDSGLGKDDDVCEHDPFEPVP